jgi:hypothetical protein
MEKVAVITVKTMINLFMTPSLVGKTFQADGKPSSFLDIEIHNVHIRPFVNQPFFKLLEHLPDFNGIFTDGDEAELGSAMDILHAYFGGGDIEVVPCPRQDTVDYAPFVLERAAGKVQM